jgi:hypothetical protein
MRAKFIYEKFTDDNSDPIKDMGIGNPEKTILPMLVKELAKYDIDVIFEKDTNLGKGFWYAQTVEFNLDDDDYYPEVQLDYATDEAAEEEEWKGGFHLCYDDGDEILEPTHDIQKVFKALLKIKYGSKKEIDKIIKITEKKLNILKNVKKVLDES